MAEVVPDRIALQLSQYISRIAATILEGYPWHATVVRMEEHANWAVNMSWTASDGAHGLIAFLTDADLLGRGRMEELLEDWACVHVGAPIGAWLYRRDHPTATEDGHGAANPS